MMGGVIRSWLRWRYGGNVFALKPPLGWPPWRKPRLWARVRYRFAVRVYLLELRLFGRYGQPMRQAWIDSQRRVEGLPALRKV